MEISTLHCILICVLFSITSQVRSEIPLTPDDVCEANPKNKVAAQLASQNQTCVEDAKKAKWHPDISKDTGEIFETYHYPYKVYNNITTKDGYILTVYRITGSPHRQDQDAQKPAVFLQHGMAAASDTWTFQPGNRNLIFKLADAGYEVWIGNARGTSYSVDHVKYNSSKDLAYWDFSWHEMGIYDLPAVINTILHESKNEKIFYIGHSMGTTMYFVSLSEIPEMNDKIQAGFMMSPVAFLGHTNNNMRMGFSIVQSDFLYKLANLMVQGRFQFGDSFWKTVKSTLGGMCDMSMAKCGVCDNILFLSFGYDGPQINNTELPNIMARFPNTICLKVLAHYAQCASTCTFKKYDYGMFGNQEKYNSSKAPDYKLQNIKTPTYLIYGENDNIGPPNDVRITASKFSEGVIREIYKVPHDLFNHVDFLIAKDADKLVYNHILEEMEKFKEKKSE